MTSTALWESRSVPGWRRARDGYPLALEETGNERLRGLDAFVRETLPARLRRTVPPSVTLDDLEQVVRWKMSRGTFRPRNLRLLRENPAAEVERQSRAAFAAIPDPRQPLALLAALSGVGPATASAVLGALRPDLYPFFDDRIAEAIPGFGTVKFSLGEYVRYAAALRERAGTLGDSWTAQAVGEALWAASVLG